MLLDVKNIDVLYDDFQVIWDVSINVNKAEMVALLDQTDLVKVLF